MNETRADDAQVATTAARPASRPWLSWLLAALTVLVAVGVIYVGIGGVMSTAGCSAGACSGPSGPAFGVLFYGAPVVAVVTVIATAFAARRRRGVLIPLAGLVLVVIDLVVMGASYR